MSRAHVTAEMRVLGCMPCDMCRERRRVLVHWFLSDGEHLHECGSCGAVWTASVDVPVGGR